MNIKETVAACHATSQSKGWWDDCRFISTKAGNLDPYLVQRTIPEKLCLIHSEVSEALEDYRNGAMGEGLYEGSEKPQGFPSELADIVIRVFDLAGAMEIDLEGAIQRKMAYNKTRAHRHGGKAC
jgi:NTP pyrophosphatase (non-canonical NTP hydrolase)